MFHFTASLLRRVLFSPHFDNFPGLNEECCGGILFGICLVSGGLNVDDMSDASAHTTGSYSGDFMLDCDFEVRIYDGVRLADSFPDSLAAEQTADHSTSNIPTDFPHNVRESVTQRRVMSKMVNLKQSLSTYVPRARITLQRTTKKQLQWAKSLVSLVLIYFEKLKGIPGETPPECPRGGEIAFSFIILIITLYILSLFSWTIFPEILVMGSFASSTALIFANPANPNAQPRSVILSHIMAAFLGSTFRILWMLTGSTQLYGIVHALLAAAAASSAAALMQVFRIMHPAACSTALIALQFQHSSEALPYGYVLVVSCALGSIVVVMLGVFLNNLKQARQYPVYWW
eukprot:ANDGO_00345.mRNA.1 Transmembrane protein DDB_G0273707/DDB_G0273361